MSPLKLARTIDHTLLKPEATADQIIKLCEEARRHGFASVCVNPYWVRLAVYQLQKSGVKVCSVVGFPLGMSCTRTKVYEAREALNDGADEIDMVVNLAALKSRNDIFGIEIGEIRDVVQYPLILKVIIETAALTDDEIRYSSETCVKYGAHYIKTSTGFYDPPHGGAKAEHVRLIKSVVGDKAQIKASGGIKTHADALKFIAAGASRIGTSSGVAIMKEAEILDRYGALI